MQVSHGESGCQAFKTILLSSHCSIIACHISVISRYGTISEQRTKPILYPRKDVAEMVIVFCVSPIVPEGLVLMDMK